MRKVKTAVFGGSFNPVHSGHLIAAQQVLEKTGCTELWFLPCYRNPLKKRADVKPEQRLKMLQIAVKGVKGFKASGLEIKRKGKSYSIETILQLKQKFPRREFFWVIGSNILGGVSRWADAERFLKEVRLIVVKMHGFQRFNVKEKALMKRNHSIVVEPEARLAVTSSIIRKRVKEGKPIRFLVPERVERFIRKNRLYQ